MRKLNQDGAVSGLALSFGLSVILLVAAISFSAWAFSSRQDYKDNVDEKIQAAARHDPGKQDITPGETLDPGARLNLDSDQRLSLNADFFAR